MKKNLNGEHEEVKIPNKKIWYMLLKLPYVCVKTMMLQWRQTSVYSGFAFCIRHINLRKQNP
jgi:hypothetical protein